MFKPRDEKYYDWKLSVCTKYARAFGCSPLEAMIYANIQHTSFREMYDCGYSPADVVKKAKEELDEQQRGENRSSKKKKGGIRSGV